MMNEPGRNDPCYCGSGEKYKYCCEESADPDFSIQNGKIVPGKLDEKIETGYQHWEDDEVVDAADCWLDAWETLQQFVDESTASYRELTDRIGITASLEAWADRLENCLRQAGESDEAYYRRLIDYSDQFCEQFPDSQPNTLVNRRRAAAEACFHLGEVQKGERRFEKLLGEYPESPWVYLNWGDMYSLFRRNEAVPHDPDRSRELYEEARPLLEDHEKEAVDDRLDDLSEE